jgi:hypothetical protein
MGYDPQHINGTHRATRVAEALQASESGCRRWFGSARNRSIKVNPFRLSVLSKLTSGLDEPRARLR